MLISSISVFLFLNATWYFSSWKTVMCFTFWYVAKGFHFWKVFLFLNKVSQVPDSKRTIVPLPPLSGLLTARECATTRSRLPVSPTYRKRGRCIWWRKVQGLLFPLPTPRKAVVRFSIQYTRSQCPAHRKFVYWPLFMSSNVQEIWNCHLE